MKIDTTQHTPTTDPVNLTGVFGLNPGNVIALTRSGAIARRFEIEGDEEAGPHGLTFRSVDLKVRVKVGRKP